MATVLVKLKIFPKVVETDFDKLASDCSAKIEAFGGKVLKTEKEPIAFGMNALIIYFSTDESKGGTDPLEAQLAEIEEISSVTVEDVRRAIG